jgi:gamma-glutamyltranspeptidase/glutathione hydrolase
VLVGWGSGQEGALRGCVAAGQPEAEKTGMEVLAGVGNAIDAAVAAALTAAVVAIQQCGIAGYGGHMTIALAGSKKVTSIDFNSTAPAAARADMFPLDEKGEVKGRTNVHGWLAASVPGTLAGLQLALDRYGTQPLRKLLQPAIRFARDGYPLSQGLANTIRTARPQLLKDEASARLLLDNGEPPKPGALFRNPDLAKLLETLANENSVEAFYRGPIAKQIAAAFRKHGGIVTVEDLAAYQAREVEPLELSWRGYSIRTAPLTAGGLSVLQALAILKALAWEKRDPNAPEALHTKLEALRVTWHDRLQLLGDPAAGKIPVERLLSESFAQQRATQVLEAVRAGKPIAGGTDGRSADGTIHLSVTDGQGNLVALTLTHGNAFGAQVAVEGLGLILGHGMIRFDPHPGRPNSVGPRKRPLHNMCPTIVLKDGKPVLALGGRGGRKIPNAIFEVLARHIGHDQPIEQAAAALRLHTEGGLAVTLESKASDANAEFLTKVGYQVQRGASAVVSAVAFDPATGLSCGVTR